jgi:hypothetical protein
MRKALAFGEAVGLPPFASFGDAARGRETRRPAAPFGCAREGETAPCPREAPRPQRGASRGVAEGPSPP